MRVTVITKVNPSEYDSTEFDPTATVDFPGPASPGEYTITERGVADIDASTDDTVIYFKGGGLTAKVSNLLRDERVKSIHFER